MINMPDVWEWCMPDVWECMRMLWCSKLSNTMNVHNENLKTKHKSQTNPILQIGSSVSLRETKLLASVIQW